MARRSKSMDSEESKEGIVVVVGCMDRRLVETLRLFNDTDAPVKARKEKLLEIFKGKETGTYKELASLLDEIGGKKVIVLANAGTNVAGLHDTIQSIKENYTIDLMVSLAHTQCGGMGAVTKCATEGVSETDGIYSHLGVSRYKKGIASGKSAEEQNPHVQHHEALKYATVAKEVLIDVTQLKYPSTHAEEHPLFVATPAAGSYTRSTIGAIIPETYVIVGKPSDVKVDLKIAATIPGMQEPTRVKWMQHA
jgi:carbonic anhydrase